MLDVRIKIVHVKWCVHDPNAMRHSFDVAVTSRLCFSHSLSLTVYFILFLLFLTFLVFYDFTSHFLLFAMFNVGFFYFFFRVHFLCACFCFFFFFVSVHQLRYRKSISVDVCSVTNEISEIQLNVIFFFSCSIYLFQ